MQFLRCQRVLIRRNAATFRLQETHKSLKEWRQFGLVSFLSVALFSFAFGLPDASIDFHFKNYYKPDTPFPLFYDAAERYFGSQVIPAYLVVQAKDPEEGMKLIDEGEFSEGLDNFFVALNKGRSNACQLGNLAETDVRIPFREWMRKEKRFDGLRNSRENGTAFGHELSSYLEADQFEFLGGVGRVNIPGRYQPRIAFEEGKVLLIQFQFTCTFSVQSQTGIDQMNFLKTLLRELVPPHPQYDAYVYASHFLLSERDQQIKSEIFLSLSLAVIAVGVAVLIFERSLKRAVFCGVSVLLIDAMLVGLVTHPAGFALDIVGFVVLAMTVGMSVDYVVHMAHAFFELKEEGIVNLIAFDAKKICQTPLQFFPNVAAARITLNQAKMAVALASMGKCILEGGGSTFLGILVLGFAKSRMFLQFFGILSLAIFLGLFMGLLWGPLFLVGLMDVFKGNKPTQAENDEAVKQAANENNGHKSQVCDSEEVVADL